MCSSEIYVVRPKRYRCHSAVGILAHLRVHGIAKDPHEPVGLTHVEEDGFCLFAVNNKTVRRIPGNQQIQALGSQVAAFCIQPLPVLVGDVHGALHFCKPHRVYLP